MLVCLIGNRPRCAYLLAIATHAADVQVRPSAWLPWNYLQSENPAALHHDPPGWDRSVK